MLEQVRDVVIIISGFMVIGAALIFTVLTIMVYRKVAPTLDAAQGFFTDLKRVSSAVSGKFSMRAIRGAVFAAGLRKAVSAFSKRAEGKEK